MLFQEPVHGETPATYFESGLVSIPRPQMGLMNLRKQVLNLQISGL